jgi:hypothetical protein
MMKLPLAPFDRLRGRRGLSLSKAALVPYGFSKNLIDRVSIQNSYMAEARYHPAGDLLIGCLKQISPHRLTKGRKSRRSCTTGRPWARGMGEVRG